MNIKKAIVLLVLSGTTGNNIFAAAEAGKETTSTSSSDVNIEMLLDKIDRVKRDVPALNISESDKQKIMQLLDEYEDIARGFEEVRQHEIANEAIIKRLKQTVLEIKGKN